MSSHQTIAGVRSAVQGLVYGGLLVGLDKLGLSGEWRTEVLVVGGAVGFGAVAYFFNWVETHLPKVSKVLSLGLAEQAARYREE